MPDSVPRTYCVFDVDDAVVTHYSIQYEAGRIGRALLVRLLGLLGLGLGLVWWSWRRGHAAAAAAALHFTEDELRCDAMQCDGLCVQYVRTYEYPRWWDCIAFALHYFHSTPRSRFQDRGNFWNYCYFALTFVCLLDLI